MGVAGQRSAGRRRVILWVAGALVLAAAGPGCQSQSSSEARQDLEKLAQKEKPKPPFDPLQVLTEPNERSVAERKPEKKKDEKKDELDALADEAAKQEEEVDPLSQLRPRGYTKPGHWTAALVTTTANDADFVGELASTPQSTTLQPIDLDNSAYRLTTARPAAFPKGQRKTLETIFFAPTGSETAVWRGSTMMFNQLRDPRRGTVEWTGPPELIEHMPAFQYYWYVLARDSSRYRYLKVLDSVRPPLQVPTVIADDQNYYRVVTPPAEAPLALPARALAWTSIAYVLWDDVPAATLSPQQQQAMLDWLHWGGGLVVSGPRTLDALRGTFLEPYLPALAAETAPIDSAALAELNAHWTVPDSGGQRQNLAPLDAVSGIKLAKHPQAEFVWGTGQLVVERRVGRGRIVATAFRLSERELLNWPSFDSFVNGCLLRRAPRVFDPQHQQVDFLSPGGLPLADSFDPKLITGLRIFARDTDTPRDDSPPPTKPRPLATVTDASGTPLPDSFGFDEQDRLSATKSESGTGGWNDFSAASDAARASLREAAGIAVPNRRFVLWMVGLYLVLIVPLNWLVFRATGRVELAWLAVPVLAVAWGIVVVWFAQLDIGFARAETEVAVLEAQRSYSRGHLTRYMALYTSLSTTYDVRFDDPAALALPLALDRAAMPGEGRTMVTLRGAADGRLDDFIVSSNSTGMVHSEQFVSLGGTLDYQQDADGSTTLANNTRLLLSGVVVLRRRAAAGAGPRPIDEADWIGELAPGAKVVLDFQPRDVADAEIAAARARSPITVRRRPTGNLSLRRLVTLAEDRRLLAPGDVRLVAWYGQGLSGVHAEPDAAQARRATLVVANLAWGDAPAAPDQNLRVKPVEPED
jgi:hypothetical protein